MQPTTFSPDNTEDLEFRIDKFDYYSYLIKDEGIPINGILRIAVVPFKILKLKTTKNDKPQFLMQSANVISFINKGKPGIPNYKEISPEELESLEKIDVTDMLDVHSEPYNVYIVINSRPHYRIRAKSTVTKVEIVMGFNDYFGNPTFAVDIGTSISYSYISMDPLER
jgi:hypothetical protein